MSDGFKCWREPTSTSPSKRHLGYYKSLITSDGNENDKNIIHFNASMLQLHNTLINASISIGSNYDREREKESKNKHVESYKQIRSGLQSNANFFSGHIKSHTT